MDYFLRDIYIHVLKKWILFQHESDYHIYQHPELDHKIVIETKYGRGEIVFNDLNVIELSVVNTMTDTPVFYLHFQLHSLKHAVELFHEMMDTMKTLVTKPKTRILLSCSSGLTTGFFAEKLNEAVKLLDANYQFNAKAYSELFDHAQNYDVILLAPQISYMQPKIQEMLKDHLVLPIPSQVFASYDVKKMLKFIEEELSHHQKTESVLQLPNLKISLEHHHQILCIALLRMGKRVRLLYRVYDEKNQILEDSEMLKNHVNLQDIRNLIRFILLKHPDISVICVSKPGHADTDLLMLGGRCDVEAYLSRNFTQKIILTNDANDIALGYYACQDQYSSLSFVFQPIIGHYGSVGSIHNGQLINGDKIMAGEILYNPIQYSENFLVTRKTPEGTLEWAAKNIITLITILGPELILIFSPLISNGDEIKEEIKKYIPEYYIPQIVKIEGLKEYLLIGQLVQCAHYIQKELC